MMGMINIEDIQAEVKAELLKELEATAMKNKIEQEVQKKVTELAQKTDAAWQDWAMLRIWETSQWEEYDKMLQK